jgi:hypothetical protein
MKKNNQENNLNHSNTSLASVHNKINDKKISIDEMIKIHNENLRKRKFSKSSKENNDKKKKIENIPKSQGEVKHIKLNLLNKNEQNGVKNSNRNINNFMPNTNNVTNNNIRPILTANYLNNISINSINLLKSSKKNDSRETNKISTNKNSCKRVNRFDQNLATINSNDTLRRATTISSSENYIQKENRIKNESKSRNKNNKSSSITYCPRIHSSTVLKKVNIENNFLVGKSKM